MVLFKAAHELRERGALRTAGLLLSAAALSYGAATLEATNTMAQTKPAAPAPGSPQPAETTATFDDWVLTCQRAGPADKQIRVCEIGEIIKPKDQQNPVARVAIGKLSKTDPLHFTALLPPNVSFPSSVRVGLSETDPAAIDLPWHRCVAGFCQADIEIHDDLLKTWRAATDLGRITFKDAAGRSVAIPLSLKGLGPALDQLAKEMS